MVELCLLWSPSWGMPTGRGRHVDPHHRWSSFSRSGPDCALGLSHRQKEEPRWLPNHLRWLHHSLAPVIWGPIHDINHCLMRLYPPPPFSPLSSLCSVMQLFIILSDSSCAFWTHPKGNCLKQTLYWCHLKQRGRSEGPKLNGVDMSKGLWDMRESLPQLLLICDVIQLISAVSFNYVLIVKGICSVVPLQTEQSDVFIKTHTKQIHRGFIVGAA